MSSGPFNSSGVSNTGHSLGGNLARTDVESPWYSILVMGSAAAYNAADHYEKTNERPDRLTLLQATNELKRIGRYSFALKLTSELNN